MKTLILTVLLLASPLFATEASKEFLCSTGYTSNLRSGPGVDEDIVTQLSKYTPLLALKQESGWSKVKTPSFEGWVYNELLSDSLDCALATQSYKTHSSYSQNEPHRYRKTVITGEGFKILSTKVGLTQVKDKVGNVFWLENHILWPKEKLKSLHL